MPKITYQTHDGRTFAVDANLGQSLMEAAVKNSVPGIEADCGGACACATCHVYLDAGWREVVGPPADLEASMLDFVGEVTPDSRLACQISVNERLEGLVVRIPGTQR